jgi:hypothetical protein
MAAEANDNQLDAAADTLNPFGLLRAGSYSPFIRSRYRVLDFF